MAAQLSLLDDYPNTPGFKARDTARAAAEGIAQTAKALRLRILDLLALGPRSPEEAAQQLGVPVMNVRPRMSELSGKGLIEDSGQRRTAMGGRKAIVWRLKSDG